MKTLIHHGMHLAGVGPFITFRSYQLAGRRIIWQAREQRKGLLRAARAMESLPLPLWQTRIYNQLMGSSFAVGAMLFIMGSLLSMLPQPSATLTAWTNWVFFIGSIPFTAAAYLQHFQAANARRFTVDPSQPQARVAVHWLGWQPKSLGWLSTLTQLLGTLAFNVSTLGAVLVANIWYLQDLVFWLPDMLGSVLFLVSAYLAFMEANHSLWVWKPAELAWRIVFINLLGCVAFMVAACMAYVPEQGLNAQVLLLSNIALLVGAVCFFWGALLTVRESKAADM